MSDETGLVVTAEEIERWRARSDELEKILKEAREELMVLTRKLSAVYTLTKPFPKEN